MLTQLKASRKRPREAKKPKALSTRGQDKAIKELFRMSAAVGDSDREAELESHYDVPGHHPADESDLDVYSKSLRIEDEDSEEITGDDDEDEAKVESKTPVGPVSVTSKAKKVIKERERGKRRARVEKAATKDTVQQLKSVSLANAKIQTQCVQWSRESLLKMIASCGKAKTDKIDVKLVLAKKESKVVN